MNSSPQAPPTSRNTGGPSLGTIGSPSTVIWVAILLVIGLFVLTREPSVSPATIETLASRFQFDIEQIESTTHAPRALLSTREVHPSLERIRSWISGTGAAATLADLDGDGHLDLLLGNFFQDGADILNPEGTGVVTVMQAGKSNARNGGGAKLFLWTPPQDRTQDANPYRDHSDALEKHCGKGWVLAMGAVDLDPDNTRYQGLPEIYIAHDFGPDRLLHNRSTPGHPEFALCSAGTPSKAWGWILETSTAMDCLISMSAI